MSDQTLPAMLDAIREDLLALSDIRRVYESVPESLNELPAVIVASMGGRSWLPSQQMENGSFPLNTEHDIRIEIHIPRKNLPDDHAAMARIADDATLLVYAGFATDRYSGTMVTTGNPQTSNGASSPWDYTIGPSEWAGQKTYAMLADFRVTTQREIAV